MFNLMFEEESECININIRPDEQELWDISFVDSSNTFVSCFLNKCCYVFELVIDNSINRDRIIWYTNMMLGAPIAVNPESSLLWDPDLGPSSPSRTNA